MENINIAVIGLGPAGLAALKSLREEGFDAVGFERRDTVGGLWSYSDNPAFTSALNETFCNISKFVFGFSDYPVPKDFPPFPTSPQLAEYFDSYASHFGLHDHICFNTTVRRVTRNTSKDVWDVHITNPDGDTVLSFDKVVFGHGCESVPLWPPMPNREKFRGIVMHSQAYKTPDSFRDKRVLVVGMGNTACEISLTLCKHASKLYQGYRRGRIMVSRYQDDGIPLDTQLPWPTMRLKYLLDNKMPGLMASLVDRRMIDKMISDVARFEPAPPKTSHSERLGRAGRRVREDWRLLPAPSMAHTHPAVQEDFIPALYEGDIIPVKGFEDFVGDHQVLLQDGEIVEVDAVIFCTGYKLDFSIMPELEMDGAGGLLMKTAGDGLHGELTDQDETLESRECRQKPHLPRLFHTTFPPRWASSIAFLSWMSPQENVWGVCELVSMAVAQIWAAETVKSAGEQPRIDGYRQPALLPSVDEMNAEVDAYHNWWRGEWEKDHSIRSGYVRAYSFYRFMHDAAGTGLYDNLDHIFSSRGWALWWNDRELWTWLAKGPMNSYSWRLFETNPKGIPGCGRKAWPRARKTLQEAYDTCEEFKHQAQANYKERMFPIRNK
ncbi:FAD/NAD(P)-binding domain-containing protein [Hypomontagnella monticulosa]|nr:FAD/NAD(P)-binding domain-containing protein [Hypomontagnella monticulosa]